MFIFLSFQKISGFFTSSPRKAKADSPFLIILYHTNKTLSRKKSKKTKKIQLFFAGKIDKTHTTTNQHKT